MRWFHWLRGKTQTTPSTGSRPVKNGYTRGTADAVRESRNRMLDQSQPWNGVLDLSQRGCTSGDLRLLSQESEALRHGITSLNLWRNALSDAAAVATCLKRLPMLTALNLADNRLSDAGALGKGLKCLRSLTSLNLANNRLRDATPLAKCLGPLTNLTFLDLWNNDFADVGPLSGCLRRMPNLSSLNLGCNGLSDPDALARCIHPLRNLRSLYLGRNHLSDAGALAACLAPMTGLTDLDLGGNEISDAEALRSCFEPLTDLTSLCLEANGFFDAAILAACLGPLRNLRSLNLKDNGLSDIAILDKYLSLLGNLNELILSNNRFSDTTAMAQCLQTKGTLTRLDLRRNNLRDAATLEGCFECLRHLAWLNLGHNGLSDAAALADGIRFLTDLTHLDLGYNHLVDASALANGLRHLKTLTSLNLVGNHLWDNHALSLILQHLPDLRWVNLRRNPCGVPDDVLCTYIPGRIAETLRRVVPSPPKAFRWVHFSDLHWGLDAQQGRWATFKQELIIDLRHLCTLMGGPIDAVFFTGDLVQKGTEELFRSLEAEMRHLAAGLAHNGVAPILVVIPGNHDLSRPKPGDDLLRLLAPCRDVSELDSLFRRLLDRNTDTSQGAARLFEQFVAWDTSGDHGFTRPDEVRPGLLPGDLAATITAHDGIKIGVVGLNTTLQYLSDNTKPGDLAVHRLQMFGLFENDVSEWCDKHHVCMLLTHHPHTWFSADALRDWDESIYNVNWFPLHLCGHMHGEEETSYSCAAGNKVRRTYVGPPLFMCDRFVIRYDGESVTQERRFHGYTAGMMTVRPNSKVASMCYYPREYIISGGATYFGPGNRLRLKPGTMHTEEQPIQLRRCL